MRAVTDLQASRSPYKKALLCYLLLQNCNVYNEIQTLWLDVVLWIVTLTVDWKFYISECLPDQETRLFCSKGVKIVWDSSTVSEKVMCDICNASLMSQAYLDRHMKWKKCNFLICCILLNFGNVTIEENHGIYCSRDACEQPTGPLIINRIIVFNQPTC